MPTIAEIDSKAVRASFFSFLSFPFLCFLSSSGGVSLHVDSEYSNIALTHFSKGDQMALCLASETQPRLLSLGSAIEDGKDALEEYVTVDGEWGFAECGLDAAEARCCWKTRVSRRGGVKKASERNVKQWEA